MKRFQEKGRLVYPNAFVEMDMMLYRLKMSALYVKIH
jgi:hypothetical protein